MLKTKLAALSYVGPVNVFDSEGVLINSSNIWPVPAISVADRAYFKTFKADPNSPSLLVEPVKSRVTGAWTTIFAHKLTGPNGEYLGSISRGIEHAQFEKFFATVGLGDSASISMFHYDGTLIARYPHVDAMIGTKFKPGPLRLRVQSPIGYGTIRVINPIDGQDRLISARSLTDLPLLISATTTVSAALTDWRTQTGFLIGMGGSSVIIIAAMLFLVVRKLSQQHRLAQQRLMLEKQRLDTAVNNMTQGLLLFDSSQRLVRLQSALHRHVWPLAGNRQTRLQLPCDHRPSRGHRIVRGECRSILLRWSCATSV